jgi:hypothetical protein
VVGQAFSLWTGFSRSLHTGKRAGLKALRRLKACPTTHF